LDLLSTLFADKRYYTANCSPFQEASRWPLQVFLQRGTDYAIMRHMSDEIPDAVRAYMSQIGSKKTEAKKDAARRNGAATRFAPKPLEELECTCGKCPSDPKTYCPRGRAIIRRRTAS
jgi:hypothetical protein